MLIDLTNGENRDNVIEIIFDLEGNRLKYYRGEEVSAICTSQNSMVCNLQVDDIDRLIVGLNKIKDFMLEDNFGI